LLKFVKYMVSIIDYFPYFSVLLKYHKFTIPIMKKNYFFFTALFIIVIGLKVNAQTGSWTTLSSGSTTNFLGVSAPSTAISYVCGGFGDIRKTINGGVSWTPLTSGTGENLYSIFFTNDLIGYAVGDNGVAIKTTNGGTSWVPMSLVTTDGLKHVWFLDANTGFISGGVTGVSGSLFKTIDGGTTWTSLSITSTSVISSVFFTSTLKGYASAISGSVFKSVDGGTTWGAVSSGTTSLQDVQFTSTSDGIVISQTGTIAKTTTIGTSWSAVPSGTTDALTGIDFYDASNGVIVGGNVALDTGIILTTANSGASWSPTIISSSQRLVRVDFFDATTGYAVGFGGTILKWSIPIPPDANFSSSAPGCMGQGVDFYSVMAGITGVTHTWNLGLGATPATSSSINPTGIMYSSPGAKIITHITTNSLGTDTTTMVITVNPSPTSSFTSTAPVCQGASVNFANSGTTGPGITYSWDFGAGSSPINSTAQNPTGIVYSTSGTKTITMNVTNQYGCTTSATQYITINAAPVANAGVDSTICSGNTVQIGAATVAGLSYSWSPSSLVSNPVASFTTASPTVAVTVFTVTVTNGATGCSSQDATTITMLAPVSANAGSDAEICKGDTIQIGIGAVAGQTYSWSPSTGVSDITLANPMVHPTATTTYTLTVNGNGCSNASDQVTIVVHAIPIANAGPNDTVAIGSTVQLNASGGLQYLWSPVTGLSNSNIYNPTITASANAYYTLLVTNEFGCRSYDYLSIYVFEPDFWVPTAFTPDGNGVDDVFFVRGQGIQDLEFSVFNRWGERIFFSKDITIGWDGTRQTSGDKLPEGAYVYQIKGLHTDGTPLYAKGLINLIR
jgi:gliding motility-associated-like protein